ncbi:MAG TPA: MmgE/PrpD family protein, partial [Anaerolineae bacterium]
QREKIGYEGFRTQPMSWAAACDKFARLAGAATGGRLLDQITAAVSHLDEIPVRDLTELLATVRVPAQTGGAR